MRALFVDSFAALVFFTLVAGFVEIVVAGMTWEQVATARGAAIPLIVATGRLYGLWRDAVFRRTKAAGRSPIGRTITDIFAFLSFQVPVYAAILVFAGASLQQMSAAIGAAAVLMPVISRPYGVYLDLCRRVAGTTPCHAIDA